MNPNKSDKQSAGRNNTTFPARGIKHSAQKQPTLSKLWLDDDYKQLTEKAKDGDDIALGKWALYVDDIVQASIKTIKTLEELSRKQLEGNLLQAAKNLRNSFVNLNKSLDLSLDEIHQENEESEEDVEGEKKLDQPDASSKEPEKKLLPRKEFVPSNLGAFANECREIIDVFDNINEDLTSIILEGSAITGLKINPLELSEILDETIEKLGDINRQFNQQRRFLPPPAYEENVTEQGKRKVGAYHLRKSKMKSPKD